MAQILAQKKFANAIREANQIPLPDGALDPGHMRLYSYYKPSLEAGRYGIEAKQTVTADSQAPLKIFNYKGDTANENNILTQDFEVIAPQFSIDADKINSYYPPPGHSDEGRILPHIVFNDPHFPWLRRAGEEADNLKNPVDPDSARSNQCRNQVPWLAVVVFDPNELTITPQDASDLGLVASDGTTAVSSYDATKLPASGAFPMQVKEYLTKIMSRIYYEAVFTKSNDTRSPGNQPDWIALQSSTESTSVIFPTKARVKELFGGPSDTQFATLEGYKYLSHVRHVNTVGFPDAGVEEEGYFSICVSATTGDIKTTVPKTMIAHLVSLEHLDATLKNTTHGITGNTVNRVGLISLYNWMYTVIPGGPSFVDEMQHLADTAQTLKPPLSVLSAVSANADNTTNTKMKTAAKLLYQRAYMVFASKEVTYMALGLDRGFTINRWRTATGEETVAFNRGPLTPSIVPQHPSNPQDPATDDWVGMSMHGKEFQIWDAKCGVMDLTYSNAWNLGRLASIGDGPFNAAILRFRSYIWKWASSNTRRFVNNVPSSQEVSSRTLSLIAALHEVRPAKFQGDVSRVNPPVKDSVAPPLSHPTIAPLFAQALTAEVDKATSAGGTIYTSFSTDKAASADWVSIFNWVQDALFLAKIPAHYLFQEPSHIKGAPVVGAAPGNPALPPEALRFFHIDDTWMDCFIDGALSVANHLEPEFDRTRVRIKEVFNYYFQDDIANSGMKPIVPRSGFIIRSAVVKSTPDLRITASTGTWDDTTSKWIEYKDSKGATNNPIVRLTRLDDFTILCLFECPLAEVWHIKLAQPPHQQRFAIASGLPLDAQNVHQVTFTARRLYMQNAPPNGGEWQSTQLERAIADTFVNVDTRCIDPKKIAFGVNDKIRAIQGADYTDLIPNSAEVGLELNDPSYQLDLQHPLAVPTRKTDAPVRRLRQFWVKPGEDPLVDTPLPHDPARSLLPIRTTASKSLLVSSKTTTPSSIAVPTRNKDFEHPTVLAAPLTHTSRVISRATIPRQIAATVDTPPAQFQTVVCVDYRPAPPLPGTANGAPCYAPFDYIPTGTKTDLDLIIVIVRIDPKSKLNLQLASIDVELPVFDDKSNNKDIEPLFKSDPYRGHARMASNLRFVPTLYNNERVSGAKPILGVRLLPRSGKPDATITVSNNGRTFEATVRLSSCKIAPTIASPKPKLPIAVAPNQQKFQERGKVFGLLRERYNAGGSPARILQRETKFLILKNDVLNGIDTDANGKVVNV